MPLSFLLSQKGKRLLLHENYLYQYLRQTKIKVTWRCIEYGRKQKCNCLIYTTSDTKNGTIIGISEAHHSHAPDINDVKARKALNKAKKKAANSAEPTATILTHAMRNVSASTATKLPPISAITRTIQRVRQMKNPQLETPASRGDLELPQPYTETINGQPFLLYDSEGDRKRFLILCSNDDLNQLTRCTHWFCDGTFQSVPTIFNQLYTIHGMIDEKILPLVYILTPNRTARMYQKILEQLKDKQPHLNPEVIVVDFEQAFISAIAHEFPNALIRGCFFHFAQSLWRHVQSSGLQTRYGEDEQFALHIRMLSALAFVPVGDVLNAFNTLINSQFFKDNEEDLQDIKSYFTNTWIGFPRRQTWRKPLYAIDLWNVHLAVRNKEPRTNNAVEGWHNEFNRRVAVAYAKIGKFIVTLKEEQHTTALILEQHLAGRCIAPKRRKTYRDLDERLEKITADYNETGDVLEYLRSSAHNITF